MTHTPSDTHRLTVEERGRLVIPAQLRRALGIVPGTELLAHVDEGGRLVLEDRRRMARRLRGSWKELAAGHDLVGELLAERRAEAALEDAEATGDEEPVDRARERPPRPGAPR